MTRSTATPAFPLVGPSRARQPVLVATRFVIGVVVVACLASGCDRGSPNAAAPTSTSTIPAVGTIVLPRVIPKKSNCAINLVNDAFTGAYGTASAIGWAGNEHGVVTCLGGRFHVQGDVGQPFGFGIYADVPTRWTDADGYLPAQITSFSRRGVPS